MHYHNRGETDTEMGKGVIGEGGEGGGRGSTKGGEYRGSAVRWRGVADGVEVH